MRLGNEPVSENHRQPLALLPNNSKLQCNKLESMELLPTHWAPRQRSCGRGCFASYSPWMDCGMPIQAQLLFLRLPHFLALFLVYQMEWSSYYNIFPFYLLWPDLKVASHFIWATATSTKPDVGWLRFLKDILPPVFNQTRDPWSRSPWHPATGLCSSTRTHSCLRSSRGPAASASAC